MQLGPYRVTARQPGLPPLTLAPMAGVSNWVFRLVCARLGAAIVGVEFVNCRNVHIDALHVRRAMDYADAAVYRRTGMSLLAAQIYGGDPDQLAAGAAQLERQGAQVVDINFGCSVPRIVEKGSGAAYLRDLDRLYRAVRATVATVNVPVIVKTRLGWDDASINVLDVVRRAADAGAQAVAIHARTVTQRYRGQADWSWIGRAVEASPVPIIGNGDVLTPQDAVAMHRLTGCDAVMIGRAAMANPWIFAGRTGATLDQRIQLATEQLRAMARFKGERTGVLETRKHLTLYFRHLPRTAALRRQLLTTENLEELIALLDGWRHRVASAAVVPRDLTLSRTEAACLGWGGGQ